MTTTTKNATDEECGALAKIIQDIIDKALEAKASPNGQLIDAILVLTTANAAVQILARRRGIDRKAIAAALSTGSEIGVEMLNRGALRLEPIMAVA